MKGNVFIKRPMAAFAISILILIIGFISLVTLPVEQYPDIAPPTVIVSATYPGADADAVMNSVIMPLEGEHLVETLVIAIILVILVVYFFLQDFKSTVIPSISIIVSLIGTFACLVAADFSLNILTLFALVLAIGIVVDDAIIVVEAVQTKFEIGYKSPYLAAKDSEFTTVRIILTGRLAGLPGDVIRERLRDAYV